MSSTKPSFLRRLFGGFWWLLDGFRRLLVNLIFLAIVIVILVALFHSTGPKLEEKTLLVLNLNGPLVEQTSGTAGNLISRQFQGSENKQVQLRDVLSVLDAAAKDPKIERVLLMLDEFSPSGLASLHEVAAAIDRFKTSGKQVVAWGSSYNQKQYYLAAHADEIYLHPMGTVYIDGFGGYRNYYKDALDRLGVTANVIKVGTYKNYGEGYSANAPSKESLEAESYLYDGLWATYTSDVEKARKLPAGSIVKDINTLPEQFAAIGNDGAKLAVKEKLVDGLKTRDEMRQMLIERGARDDESKSVRQVSYDNYLAGIHPDILGDGVGVIVAEGEISDGVEPPGKIGGRSTSELIRKAREDDKIKAIVLRVNSPGGSAFASELIRRELEVTRLAGKPVVVSMGDVAASGGYWITMSSDEVIADPATISGSIGVIAILPTADKAMEKLSINTGGYTTTWLRGAYDPRRPMDPRFAQLIQGSIDNIYTEFTSRAAAARKTTREKINEVGQGRVWSGEQAKQRNLVDRLGSFGDAIKAAETRAKIPENSRVMYVEPDVSPFMRLLEKLDLDSMAATLMKKFNLRLMPLGVPDSVTGGVQRDMSWLADIADKTHNGVPFVALAHCMCDR
jgi:protease IV